MKIKEPKNSNYAAILVEIKTLVTLENCDNVQAAIILGNQVIVDKSVKIGDVGLYFPLECQLSKEYLSSNNLYRKPELNSNPDKKGYFEENGRVRCVKFRGNKSEGLFMPYSSISFINQGPNKIGDKTIINLGDCFDELNGVPICTKYVVKTSRNSGTSGSKNTRNTKKYESKLVENQFRFHQDTSMLYKNLHRINPDSLISITYKLHGTSGISSYVLCKRKLNWIEKLLYKLKAPIKTEQYDYLYSSRKVIKNEELNPNAQHYYNVDIWGIAHRELESFLEKGMTLYYEIVGYLPNGGLIQKDYDYGCECKILPGNAPIQTVGEHKIFIYRITHTNIDGKVFEFSAKQVQNWCKKSGLNAVPELFYGYAREFSDERLTEENWRNKFLETIKEKYNEKLCYMCQNEVPEEGVVIRIEGLDFEAYKQKSTAFYERETSQLDKGESNIEDEN